MVRALVFIMSLGLMISSGILIGMATDNDAEQPPSPQNQGEALSYLSPLEGRGEAAIHVE
jgi:hypothetical protein